MTKERKKDAAIRHDRTAIVKVAHPKLAPPQSQAIVVQKRNEVLSHELRSARGSSIQERFLNKQVFIELHSGSRYSGILLSVADGMIELDIGFFAAKSIAVMSEVLLPLLQISKGKGR